MQSPITIEVCIDNLESLPLAIQGGADRIELCSALRLGGLTPSTGLMQAAAQSSNIPVYAMIRPRQGDFVFEENDIHLMIADIEQAKLAGLDGIVIGVLTPQGDIDMPACKQLMKAAGPLGVTFHRAFDQCREPAKALEDIISLGCERVLTSGLAPTAEQGIKLLRDLQKQAANRIQIMAGAGVSDKNAKQIIHQASLKEIHLSGKSVRPSLMENREHQTKMGAQDIDDYQIPVTSPQAIAAVVDALKP